MTKPMDHDRCSESLGPLLRGELAPSEAGAVESHLETCAECSEERDALAVMLAVQVEPLASDERARLAQAVAAQRRAEVVTFAPRMTRWRKRVAPALGAAALIAVVAVSAVWFGSNGDDDGGGTDAAGSAGGDLAETPAPEQESLDRDQKDAKRRTKDRIVAFSNETLEDEQTSSTGSTTTTQGEASKPAPASEPFVAGDKEGGGDEGGGGTGGDGGETGPGPPEQNEKPESLSMSPTADTAEIGTCNAFTITVADEDGDPVEGVTLDIEQRHELSQDDIPANEPDVGFCTPSDGPNPSAVDQSAGDLGPPEEDPDDPGTAGGATIGTTNGDGQVTIGIEVAPANGSDGAGDVTLVVFFDTSEDDDPGSGEPQDSSTNTWVAPGQDRSPRPRASNYADRRGIF
ncbi:MAG: zf-HC2 domain-containing protein [Actinomycetota bacterium]